MTTPKTDLIDESTDPTGSNPDEHDLIRSPDAHSVGDAQAQVHRAEVLMRQAPPRVPEIRASGLETGEAILPASPVPQLDSQVPKWRGVRSKNLPLKNIQSMARAARMLYRGVLDWATTEGLPALQSKPRRDPESK